MTPHTNLPIESTAFVGRESDVGELAHLIMTTRLVTLCGTGGIGKTRLALRVAREVGDRFPDGVWLVELADLPDPSLLACRFAAPLRLPKEAGGDVTERLIAAMSGSRLLLVVDNCEHVVDECARLCARILATCAGVRLLATSREPLRVPGESMWRVPPLSLPSAECPDSEAVRLFRDRARASRPDIDWSDEAEDEIAGLCAELEGIPLAIELAAAMTRYLSVTQIRARLGDRFRLLTSGDRTAPARHRTLLATVEWSYRMLSQPERLLLERLTVFTGGWTLEMAEMVCAGGGVWHDEVLHILATLVDKSLVVMDGEVAGQIRYRMLDTLRAYAAGKLAERGEEPELRRRHLGCVSELARAVGELVARHSRAAWPVLCRHLAMLDAVRPNIPRALHWAIDTGEIERGLRVLSDLHWVLVASGRFDDMAPLLDRMLAACDGLPDALTSESMAMRAELSFLSGDIAGAARWAGQVLTRSRGRTTEVLALTLLALTDPRVPAAERGPLERAAALAAGNPYLESYCVFAAGLLAQAAGRFGEAVTHYEGVLDRLGEVSEWGMALACVGLAGVACERGDLAGALACYERAQEPLRDGQGRIHCLTGLARTAIAICDFIAWRRGQAGGPTRVSDGTAELIRLFAELAVREGDHRRAVRLLGVRDAIREAKGQPAPREPAARAEELLEPARRELGEAVVARLWHEGHGLSKNHSIEYALVGSLTEPSARILAPAFPASPESAFPPGAVLPTAPDVLPQVPAGLSPCPPFRPPGESGRVVPIMPSGVLTARENEIAALVARGLSNKGIADELVISPATVARHVANILAKLGFSSRTQIAAWVLDRPVR